MSPLRKDPINLLIVGVGGQGNVLISRLVGESLLTNHYQVVIGESHGASQRGGSVTSHIRISKDIAYSPIIPEGQGDVILGLEPVESLRILELYGNPNVFIITNTRPVYPMSVATGEATYPSFQAIVQGLNELSHKTWYVEASEIAINMDAPLLANMVMVGALVGTQLLPLKQERFEEQLEANFKGERLSLNLQAFRTGIAVIKDPFHGRSSFPFGV
jgi:indolepyruvate ferredoxin oxidoreductase beta subunit